MAKETANYWYYRTRYPDNVEYVISIDIDDPKKDEYQQKFDQILFSKKRFLVSDNTSVVQATNKAAQNSTGEILLYLSDDFRCPSGWDNLVTERTKDKSNWLLKVNDGYQRFDKDVLTIPIMSRGLYDQLKYFWHPEYRSMFVDQDLYWTAHKLGALIMAGDLTFEHMHPVAGKGKNDETYTRSNQNWDQGKALYQKRQREGFPI